MSEIYANRPKHNLTSTYLILFSGRISTYGLSHLLASNCRQPYLRHNSLWLRSPGPHVNPRNCTFTLQNFLWSPLSFSPHQLFIAYLAQWMVENLHSCSFSVPLSAIVATPTYMIIALRSVLFHYLQLWRMFHLLSSASILFYLIVKFPSAYVIPMYLVYGTNSWQFADFLHNEVK